MRRAAFLVALFVAFFVAWVVAPVGLFAQSPTTISFQGLLTQPDGAAYPDAAYDLTVRVYDAPTAGTVLWQEQHLVQTFNGVFDVILGDVSPLQFSTDRVYYLGITIPGQPEFSPRTRITGAPFAVYADSTAVSDGLTPTATGAVRSLNGLRGDLRLVGVDGVLISELDAATIQIGLDSALLNPKLDGPAGGDLTGNYPDPQIRDTAVTTAKIADAAVTTAKLAPTGVVPGTYGTEASVARFTVDASGRLTSADEVP
ncbi:MAG: hypothetical protein ACO3I4_04800, partial [Candidatus Kapaibacteriota bacterium]